MSTMSIILFAALYAIYAISTKMAKAEAEKKPRYNRDILNRWLNSDRSGHVYDTSESPAILIPAVAIIGSALGAAWGLGVGLVYLVHQIGLI